MEKPTITILGATSHIAKGLIANFTSEEEFFLQLYSRSPEKVIGFIESIGKFSNKNYQIYEGYQEFSKKAHDVIINCIGAGTLNKLEGNYVSYFTITEEFDNLVISYLKNSCPKTLYINFSSGAIYGRECSTPAGENTINHLQVNHLGTEDYYAITRLNSETKHRAFNNLNIVDIRIFSYFSRFIDLSDSYFLCEILNCILNNKVLITNDVNIVRDYINPQDLYSLIKKCIDIGKMNDAFDLFSSSPVEKEKILKYYSSEYNLKYKVKKTAKHKSPTGSKNIYCSNYNKATKFGYQPKFSSMDTIEQESKYILSRI